MTETERLQQRRAETAEATENFLLYALIDPRDRQVIPALFPASIHPDKAGCVAVFQGNLLPALYSRFQSFRRQYDNENPSVENLWLRNCVSSEVTPQVHLILAADHFPRHSLKALVRAVQTSLYRVTIAPEAAARGVRYPTPEEKLMCLKAQDYVDDFFLKLRKRLEALRGSAVEASDLTPLPAPRSVKARIAALTERVDSLTATLEDIRVKVNTNAEAGSLLWAKVFEGGSNG